MDFLNNSLSFNVKIFIVFIIVIFIFCLIIFIYWINKNNADEGFFNKINIFKQNNIRKEIINLEKKQKKLLKDKYE